MTHFFTSQSQTGKKKKEIKKEKSNACVFSLPLSGSVSLSVGEAAFLQGALTTSVGLPLSMSLFPVETAGDLVPDSRKKNCEANYSFPLFEFFCF